MSIRPLAVGSLAGLSAGVCVFSATLILHHDLSAIAPLDTPTCMTLPGYYASPTGAVVGFIYAFIIGSILGTWGYKVGAALYRHLRIAGGNIVIASRPEIAGQPDNQTQTPTSARPDGLDATRETWSQRAKERQDPSMRITAWSDSPLVHREYINPLISGDPRIGWFQWVASTFFAEPVERALSIGCGDGALERHGVIINVAQAFDAYDVSPGAIETARAAAEAMGFGDRIHYHAADLNRQTFPKAHYDAVFASQSLHHIHDLEHLFAQVHQTLKPSGLFIINEFVGPNQFQWTERQMTHALDRLLKIPETHRMSILGGGIKSTIGRPTIDTMNAVDPTEAIRSEDIIPLLYERFDILERRDFGGTLLNLVLEDIAGNFSDHPEDLALLKDLFDYEQSLLRSGELSSDFTLIVARRRAVD